METLVDALLPGPRGTFSPLEPRLRDIELDAAGVARCVHLFITTVVAPLAGLAEKGLPLLKRANLTLKDVLPKAMSAAADVIIKSSLQDVLSAVDAVEALLDPSVSSQHSRVEEVTQTRKGPLYMLSTTLTTETFWAKKLAEVERCAVASTSMLPQVEALIGDIEAGKPEAVQKGLKDLPTFQAALRVGATLALETAIARYYASFFFPPEDRAIEACMVEEAEKSMKQLCKEAADVCEPAVLKAKEMMQKAKAEQHLERLESTSAFFGVQGDGRREEVPQHLDKVIWKRVVQDLVVAKKQNLVQQFKPMPALIDAIKDNLPELIEESPSTLESVVEALEDVAPQSVTNAVKRWQAIGRMVVVLNEYDEHRSVTEYLESDPQRLHVKSLLGVYHTSRVWDASDIAEKTHVEQQVYLNKCKASLKEIGDKEVVKCKEGLLSSIRNMETAFVDWKKNVPAEAPWAVVREALANTLLAPGKGQQLQKLNKAFLKALRAATLHTIPSPGFLKI